MTRASSSKIRRGLIVAAIVLLLVAGVWGLTHFFRPGSEVAVAGSAGEIWTCSMHPQVRLPKPGKCPICSMPLIPTTTKASGGAGGGDLGMLILSDHARAMASVETVP